MEILNQILQAENLIRPYILETPVEHSPWLEKEMGADVWFKLEHIQTTGSFKLRGAANYLLNLDKEEASAGVITASTGNHGAALAYIARKLGIPCHIYLPHTVLPSKVALMELYGASLTYFGEDSVDSETEARRVAVKTGKPFVSPYNDPLIIAGQGTMGLELERQLPNLDAAFIPVGGGGLISGIAAYLKNRYPHITIVGCQPEHSPVMSRSIESGRIVELPFMETLSDGTAGGVEADSLTFNMCQKYVDQWIEVSEEEIKGALQFLLEKHYWMVEGAAGLALASLRKSQSEFEGKKIALILCGRKMAIRKLLEIYT